MKKNAIKIIVAPTLPPDTVLLVSPGALVKRSDQVIIDGEKIVAITVRSENADEAHDNKENGR